MPNCCCGQCGTAVTCCAGFCDFCNVICNVGAPCCGGPGSNCFSGTTPPPPNPGCNFVQRGNTGGCLLRNISQLGYFAASGITGRPILTNKSGQPYLGNKPVVTGTVSASSVLVIGAAAVALIVIFGLGRK